MRAQASEFFCNINPNGKRGGFVERALLKRLGCHALGCAGEFEGLVPACQKLLLLPINGGGHQWLGLIGKCAQLCQPVEQHSHEFAALAGPRLDQVFDGLTNRTHHHLLGGNGNGP